MHAVGELTAQCIIELKDIIKPGITSVDIEDYVKGFQLKHNLQNSQHGYFGFPGHCCTSINEVMCHGIPKKKDVLKEGDIIKVDVTFNKDGFHGDACYTYPVGEISDAAHKLIGTAFNCMEEGIATSVAGNTLYDVGLAIKNYANFRFPGEFSISEEFYGHGISSKMHMWPPVPHYPKDETKSIVLKPGMTFTIEPIINMGLKDHRVLEDRWTVITKDGHLSAQFERTIGISEKGYPVIFTPW